MLLNKANLRVAEFVSNEVEVPLSTEGVRYKTNHLMKGNSARDNRRQLGQV
mgnify:CR=1 FL=1